MKTIALNKKASMAALSDDLFFDENDGDFDDNWIVSANDIFGVFDPLTDETDLTTYYEQAA
ncbi:hypothetical protein [Spirosoma agri]|uniref:Uncharacterized protein n=1 Tax=Spirosoma agri TaxID=1987381 RepID=A0A6M0IS05_9BACT|nr:hypothetical protein [Spirosoma agri]NEU69773.1 hypothetical protein [Spirosoma agri]